MVPTRPGTENTSESVNVTPAGTLKNIELVCTCKIFMQIKMLQSPTFQFDIWQSEADATLISWINVSHQWKNRDHLEHRAGQGRAGEQGINSMF